MNDLHIGVSLRELMKADVFKGAKVLAGERGLDHIVTGLNQIEAPDIENYATQNQLLITTGFVFSNDKESLQRLIRTAVWKDLSGICIKTKRFMETVPEFMIREADSYDFPLVELPQEVNFTSITESIYSSLLNSQEAYQQYLLKVNDLLIKMLIEGVKLDALARTLSSLINNSVCIWDSVNNRKEICVSEKAIAAGQGESREELIEDIIRGKYIHECFTMELISGDAVLGKLFVWQTDHKCSRWDEGVVTEMARVISLDITRENSLRLVENEHFSDYIRHLFHDENLDISRESVRAKSFDLEVTKKMLVLQVSVHINAENAYYDQYMLRSHIVNGINTALLQKGYECHIGRDQDSYVLIISRPGKGDDLIEEQFYQEMRDIVRTVQGQYPSINLYAYGGSLCSGIDGLIRSWKESTIVQKYCRAGAEENRLVLGFSDIGFFRFAFSESPMKEIEDFIDSELGPLITYSQEKGNDLLLTLETYFDCMANINKVSKTLYTHYNTIIYRINRIEELTGRSLNDSEDRFNLQLALKMYRFSQPEKSPQREP